MEMETITATLHCRVHRTEECEGEVTRTLQVPKGTTPPTEFTCSHCAGKVDKLGRLRKPRPRKSLTLDNATFRVDKYRAARKPSGMTETDFKGTIEPDVALNRDDVLWLEQNLLKILEQESVVTSPKELELLKLYQAGKSHQEIASALGFSKANVGVVLGRICPRILRRIRNSATLSSLVSPISRDRDASDSDEVRTQQSQVEGSELFSETYIPLRGQSVQFSHSGPAVMLGAPSSEDPIETVAALESDDLDSEGFDYEFGMDRETPTTDRD